MCEEPRVDMHDWKVTILKGGISFSLSTEKSPKTIQIKPIGVQKAGGTGEEKRAKKGTQG